MDYAQAGELKFGQVGIANLRVRTLDPAQLAAEMRERVERAPNLFARAACPARTWAVVSRRLKTKPVTRPSGSRWGVRLQSQ